MTTLLAPPAEPFSDFSPKDEALLALLGELGQRRYGFVTPTPATHARVMSRYSRLNARDLRDVFGWTMPFEEDILGPEMLGMLQAADGLLIQADGRLQSRYRVSSLDGGLFLHSAYPTDAEDAVFFGPDSYRFARLVRSELARHPARPGARLADIGTGAGVGAIVAAKRRSDLRVIMTDINPQALILARINARAAGVEAIYLRGPDLDPVEGMLDIALANPPYIIDPAGPGYRNGGDMHGARAAYDMAVAAVGRLAPEGRFILYTGSAIIDGRDPLHTALRDLVEDKGCLLRYREIDPDVFGEELDNPAYRDVERIAVVGAVITRPR